MLATVFAIVDLVLAFGHIAEELLEGDATKFDQTILLFFRNANDLSDPIGAPWVEEMARTLRALGSYAVLSIIICAVVIYLFMARQRAAAFWVLAALGGGVLLSNVLKLAFERPRPDLVPHAARVFATSFPSGHATLSASHISRSAPFSRVFMARAVQGLFSGLGNFAYDCGRHQPHLSRRPLSNRCARRLVHRRCMGRTLLEYLQLAPRSRPDRGT